MVETGAASSELELRNGVKVQLGADSRAHVFGDRVVLDRGIGQVAQAAPFELDAGGLKIRGAGVRVGLRQSIEIAALTGVARVSGSGGVLLAAIPAGGHMNLEFQAAQTATLTRSGCLLYKQAKFIVQDDNTQEVVELAGSAQDLARNLGNRAEVKGTASAAKPAVNGATSVLTVSSVSPVSQGGCLVVASTLNAQTTVPTTAGTPAPAGTTPAPSAPTASAGGGGLSTGAKTAIILGIAAGGGGAAAAVLLSKSSKSSTSP